MTLKKLNDISKVLPDFLYLTNKNEPSEEELNDLLEECMKHRFELIDKIKSSTSNEK